MKVAVVGAGAWGKNLIRTCGKLGVLGAVVEPNAAQLGDCLSPFPEVEILPSLENLSTSKYRAVLIATPVNTHFALATRALERGFDVFVEKPMTFSYSEATALRDKVKSTDRVLMVGHLLMYQPAVRWIHSFLKEGGLGKVRAIHQERLNFGRVRTSENAMWSLGVHDLAVLLQLTERSPLSISANGYYTLGTSIEDEVSAHFEFGDGLQARLRVSWLWPERKRTLTLLGEKGMLVYDELQQKIFFHRKTVNADSSLCDEGVETVFEQKEEPLALELQHFIDCIQHRTRPLSDIENGVAVVKLLQDISVSLGGKA